MTFEELKSLLQNARWFERLGEPIDKGNKFVRLSSLAPWGNLPLEDHRLEEIADKMRWLPSSRDQVDPIHGMSLEERAELLGKKEEYSRRSLYIYKQVLASFASVLWASSLKSRAT